MTDTGRKAREGRRFDWSIEEAVDTLRADRQLRPHIEAVASFDLRSRRPYFWTLCTAIVAQQISSAVARNIIARVRALYPDRRFPDARSLLATPIDQLRAAGVSRQKATYLHALAEAYADGGLGRVRFARLSDEQVIERLTAVKGIGRWTAEMFLIFSMRRPDVFPVDDLGIRRGMENLFGVTDRDSMVERAERWRPYRTVASLYIWRALDGP